MAAIQDAVRLSLTCLLVAFITMMSTVNAEASTTPSTANPEIQVYYDSTQPAYYLYDYKLRLLIVLNDGRDSCWEVVNKTITLVCKPLKNASVKIVYEEVKEFKEALTYNDGVVEVSYRLLTFPRATFRVEAYSPEGYVETSIRVETKIWMLLTVTSFSLMMGVLVLVVRRCLW